jgi:DNA (cytosine-5)-methyltransferase 1
LWENVENLLSQKHIHNYSGYLDILKELGYTNYYKVMNSRYYGIPQSRNRIFTLSILNDDTSFEFPREQILSKSYRDYLESDYDIDQVVLNANELQMVTNFGASYSFGGSVVTGEVYPTITASYGKVSGNSGKIVCKEGYRILTPRECWRLMGFTDENYDKASQVNGASALYKQAGNSIVVDVLEAIITSLFNIEQNKNYKPLQKKLF